MTPQRHRARHRAEQEKPRPDWWVASISVAGLAVAGYLGIVKLAAGNALWCEAGGGCEIVQSSRYALFLGLPTALWGAGLYAAVAGLSLSGLTAQRWLAAFLLAVMGSSFSLYLTYLELAVIRALCGYCLASTAIAVLLLGVLWQKRGVTPGRSARVSPGRVLALGILAALGTVVIGAGVFAVESPREATAYQEALARHLSASGAVMYGAYW